MNKKILVGMLGITAISLIIGSNSSLAIKTEILPPNDEIILDATSDRKIDGKYDFYEYNQDKEAFCIEHGAAFPARDSGPGSINDARVESGTLSEVVEDPKKGDRIGEIKVDGNTTKNPYTDTTSVSVPQYKVTESNVISGRSNNFAVAYIASFFNDNESNNSYVQQALWATDINKGSTVADNALATEAKLYQAYKQKVLEAGGNKLDYIPLNMTVAGDFKETKSWIIGPFKLNYIRDFAKVKDRDKVEFGYISEFSLIRPDGKAIDSSTYEFVYENERKLREGDEDYKYPYPDEEFYIRIQYKGNEDLTKISKMNVNIKDLNVVSGYDVLEGEYNDVDWIAKDEPDWCDGGYLCRHGYKFSHRVGSGLNSTYCPGGKACSHGSYQRHIAGHTYYLEVSKVTPAASQKIIKITTSKKYYTDTPTEITYEPRRYPSSSTWPIPSIIPGWPSWPSWPDYPDWPDEPEWPELDLTMRLSGVVWEDTHTGKESDYDGLIGNKNDGTQEDGIKDVKVTLYEYGTKNVVEIKGNPTYTDESGAYYFKDVPIGKYDVEFEYDGQKYKTTKLLANGDVNDYINNPDETKYVLASKAAESESERQAYNDKFYEIYQGYARSKDGKTLTPLEYETSNGESKIKTTYETGDGITRVKEEFAMTARTSTNGIGYPFNGQYHNEDYDKVIDGVTYTQNYKYMNYINLGLVKRAVADFALTKDVYTSTLTINDKKIEYRYNSRVALDAFEISVKNSPIYKNVYYNREIYNSDYNYRIDDYKATDLNVSAEVLKGITNNKNEDQELKVFVTYKTAIKNLSELPSGTINELIDFYDEDYNLVKEDLYLPIENENGVKENTLVARKSYYEISDGRTGTLDWSELGKYGTKLEVGYKTVYTTGLENVILQTGQTAYIYVTFEVDKDNDRFVKLDEKNNVVEINNYSTFEDGASNKDKTTGQIDVDSAPGNCKPYDSSTTEDDSDSAPTINIKLYDGGNRTINGVVWEDETAVDLVTKQKVGNGEMDSGEKKIDGVRVQLVELVKPADGGPTLEYIWQEMYTGESTYRYVDSSGNVMDGHRGDVLKGDIEASQGEYRFSNYMPGDYIVRFIYGDTVKTLLPQKNGTSYNGQDYKSTTYQLGNNLEEEWYNLGDDNLKSIRMSDAKDKEERRIEVINYSKTIRNSTAKVLNAYNSSSYTLQNELMENTWMSADTAKLKVEVEYNTTSTNGTVGADSYNIDNIDFGLEKRPETRIELDKQIEGIKITLANGTVLVDTENGIKKNVNWLKNIGTTQGKIHIYMDSEVMQGAVVQIKYKIKVTNASDIDYTGNSSNSVGTTYYTGKLSSSDKIVTTSIDKVADYIDNSIVFRPDDNTNWTQIDNIPELQSIDNMKAIGYLDKDVSFTTKISTGDTIVEKPISQIVVTDKFKNSRLTPGQSDEINITLTKTISAADDGDDLTYQNVAEILEFSNDVGRKAEIPGNQEPDPDTLPTESDSSVTEEVIITPPTGENRAYYFVIGAVVLVILAGGIYLIKKKVLDK